MNTITWNTQVNAPCCPGEILSDSGESILIQSDWDYCGVATSFGWSTREVQAADPDDEWRTIQADDADGCYHSCTDGTIDCPDCGVTASEFIESARDWLDSNDGAEAEDPGYFAED